MLKSVPGLEFYGDPHHRYRYKGEWLPYTVTQVIDHDLKPFLRAQFEKTYVSLFQVWNVTICICFNVLNVFHGAP